MSVSPRGTGSRLRVSFARRDSAFPFGTPQNSITFNERTTTLEREPSNPIVLIDPHKINDFGRFRAIFYGLLLLINTSTQGLHALFGLYIEAKHNYDVHTMVDIFAAGTAFGLFVFPFGALYDFFGPKIVIILATIITAISHLLFALTFAGHIEASKTRYSIFFALMNWGCYAFDVTAIPTTLTFTPRDRAHPIGLLKVFSGLGPSVISCIFRGFFNGRYDNLMYFLMTIVIVFGIIGVIFLDNAPYIVSRWKERRLTLKEQLNLHLIRNRYMSQLLPKRRLHIVAAIMMLLNFYLTGQAIYVGYHGDTMTKGNFRGLAIGAILIVCLLVIMLLPFRCLDGATPQDHQVIQTAKEKEKELAERRRKYHGRSSEVSKTNIDDINELNNNNNNNNYYERMESTIQIASPIDVPQPLTEASPNENNHVPVLITGEDAGEEEIINNSNETPQNHPYKAVDPDVSLIEASDILPINAPPEITRGNSTQWLHNASIVTSMLNPDTQLLSTRNDTDGGEVEVLTREVSTYDHPYIETITVCGNVFVTPVYETTFLQSLTYIDLWLLFFTTFVVWGVGMTLTANWNIQVFVKARYTKLEYKTYVLFAAMSGVCMAGGRVVLGTYEVLLPWLGKKIGISLPATIGLPIPSIIITLGLILYLTLPDTLALIAVYVIAPFGYGLSNSMTIYVIGIIFKKDIGMHYGFCFLGAALGIVLLYRVLFFEVYDKHKIILPPQTPIDTHGRCQGKNCLRTTLIVYLVLMILSIGTSSLVHYRYWKLVHGKLKYRRVIDRIRSRRLKKLQKQESSGKGNSGDSTERK